MIEFIEDAHMYVVDGIILPSVTQVVGWQLGNEYKDVPKWILDDAADYGTRVHEWLYKYFSEGVEGYATDTMMMSFEQLPGVLKGHEFDFLYGEKTVQYSHYVAGTFDLLAFMDGVVTLIDHKTTSKVHTESLEWQMGLYVQAIEESLGLYVERCCCLWLPKRKRVKLIDVNPKDKAECDDLLNRWRKDHGKTF